MGQMKEIYCMVQDGSAEQFKDAYKKALINNEITFMYGGKHYDMIRAKSMIRVIEKAELEYDDYIDHLADTHAEYQADLRRGK